MPFFNANLLWMTNSCTQVFGLNINRNDMTRCAKITQTTAVKMRTTTDDTAKYNNINQ